MTHQNTILSSAQLQIVAQWIVVVANQQKTRGGELSADGAAELLRDLLGNSITFAILRGLTGGMVVNELRDKSIKLPQIAAGIFTDFARKWTPEVPHCPNRKCGLPALRPLDDMSGIEVLPEGAICPWCDGKHNVSSGESQAALINWATGVAVPPNQQYDDTIVPGTRLPLQEEELMGMARDGLRKPLRAHEVPVHAWLRYLLTQGSAFQAFGIPQVPGRVLDSLENDSVIGCGVQLVNAQIITAKRWIEGGGMKPRAAGGGGGGLLSQGCWLDQPAPLYGDQRYMSLIELLSKAYGSSPRIDMICKCAGVSLEMIDMHNGPRPIWVAIVDAAAAAGELRKLIGQMLTDGSIMSYHARIREYTGI